MTYFLGVDVGTFESKGVLVDAGGRIVAQAVAPHKMLVPRPGWAEHRPDEDWWGDTVTITRRLIAESGVDPRSIAAVAASAIGPCMLPLDAAGRPLSNGVLYGVDTRATAEIEALTRRIGADTLLARCNGGLTSQSVGPKILWFRNQHPELYAQARMFLSATPYITYRLTGRYVMDHLTAAGYTPLYDPAANRWSGDFAAGSSTSRTCPNCSGATRSREPSQPPPRRRPGSRPARLCSAAPSTRPPRRSASGSRHPAT